MDFLSGLINKVDQGKDFRPSIGSLDFLTSPFVIAAIVAIAIGMLLYYFLQPKNAGQVSDTSTKEGVSKLIASMSNEIYQTLPDGFGGQEKKKSRLAKLIDRAGDPWGLNTIEFRYLQVSLAIAGFVLGMVLFFLMPMITNLVPPIVYPIVLATFGFFIPTISYRDDVVKRDEAFTKELPSALDMLVVATSTGSPFEAGLKETCQYFREGIVKEEFEKLNVELATGKSLSAVLNDFAKHSPNDGIRTFAISLREAIAQGVPISQTLESRAEASRSEYFAWLGKKVATLETKSSLVLMVTSIPALLIVCVAPSIMTFMSSM